MIQIPHEQIELYLPGVWEMSEMLEIIDDFTADCVRENIEGLSSDQRTVLSKLKDNEGITKLSDNIKILVDTLSNPGEIGEDNLLCIHANESNFDWFNEYGDGGRWLTRSYDNIKYVTSCNAG